MKDLKITQDIYDAIAKEIHSDSSPVGIDAKKTHIIILDKLLKLEKKLEDIEKRMEQLEK
jgi:hypothetical protein